MFMPKVPPLISYDVYYEITLLLLAIGSPSIILCETHQCWEMMSKALYMKLTEQHAELACLASAWMCGHLGTQQVHVEMLFMFMLVIKAWTL